jgi:hypothetical protein
VSGIPFSLLEAEKKRALLRSTFDSLAPHDDSAFIIYQVTNELKDRGHCSHFPRVEKRVLPGEYPADVCDKILQDGERTAEKRPLGPLSWGLSAGDTRCACGWARFQIAHWTAHRRLRKT